MDLRRYAAVMAASVLLWGVVCNCAGPSAPIYQNYVVTIRGTDVQFEMVWIPEGRFWIGRTEVTWDEYLLYCDFDKAGKAPPGVDGVSKPSEPLEDVAPYDWDWGLGRRPAVGMSWNAAKNYCRWLSLNTANEYRLPTETEWKLACDGPSQLPLAECAWSAENSAEMTQEVGRKQPNRYGLHDMLGNLWEYCENPFAPDQPERAVMRGGCWMDPAAELTPDSRLGFEDDWVLADPNVPPGVWWVPDGSHLGFRVLRAAGPGR